MNQKYKYTWTYRGIIDDFKLKFGVFLFNHGTESDKNSRTALHISTCKEEGLTYKVIYEKDDRLFGDQVISQTRDKTYIEKLVKELNEHVCKNKLPQAQTLKDFKASQKVLKSVQRGYFDALEKSKLSETECAMIPSYVTEEELAAALNEVDNWYYNTLSLRVSAKRYKDQNKEEKLGAAKPIPEKFHSKILNSIRKHRTFSDLINFKHVCVQSILLAWMIYNTPWFDTNKENKKIRVIITGEDKSRYEKLYNVMNTCSNIFEFVECESDSEVEGEYKNMTTDFDLVIMNPPYSGSLHLAITETVIASQENALIISLSPARWIQDCLAKYKRSSDYKKYEHSIADYICELQSIDSHEAAEAFENRLNVQLGIYTIDKHSAAKKSWNYGNKILDKVVSKIIGTKNNVFENSSEKIPNKFSLIVPIIVGGADGHTERVSHYVNPKKLSYFNNNLNWCGETYQEHHDRKMWGNLKSKSVVNCIEYDTEEERDNAYNYFETIFFRYIFRVSQVDVNAQNKFFPYMGSILNPRTNLVGYKSSWTDSDLCEYFGITEDEFKQMTELISQYSWDFEERKEDNDYKSWTFSK